MTAQLFLTYLVFVVMAVISVSAAYLPRRMTFAIIAGLAIWLAYVGLFSALGYMRDPSLRPPGIVWLVGPFLLFVVFVVRSNIGAWVAAAIPLWLILGFESFRIGVELLIHRLGRTVSCRSCSLTRAAMSTWSSACRPRSSPGSPRRDGLG